MCISLWKNLELVLNACLCMLKKKRKKKVIVCSKGLKGAPLNTLNFFSLKFFNLFFFNIHKQFIFYQFKTFFSQKYEVIKKKDIRVIPGQSTKVFEKPKIYTLLRHMNQHSTFFLCFRPVLSIFKVLSRFTFVFKMQY